ncbi:hypothetical protein M3598_15025 [Cytobacillus oceanisediminis]|uniref:hypothetical protein n=1 Tax=Cytobacillus oceanisediminis TaxID=665099 RepID=UPI0020419186|nr:hypothetical protein [Cytobacillus oceanisediminis]MCM3244063.1 hypothetical protein [Cytobacillus oceanisediminis]
MKKKLYLVLIILLSWLTVPFIGKRDFKRFYPAAIFMCLYVLIEGFIAEKNKWWTIKERLHPKLSGELPLILGPFFAGSIWILKLTYGRPLLYILLNTVVDAFFAYPFYTWFKKIGIWKLLRFSQLKLFMLFLMKSIFMYVFHLAFVDKKMLSAAVVGFRNYFNKSRMNE